jgi:hypothetical protein
MKWNRNRNVLVNGIVGALIGYAIARWRGRDDKRKIAVIVGLVFAVLNFLTYERVSDLDDLPEDMPDEMEEAVETDAEDDEE